MWKMIVFGLLVLVMFGWRAYWMFFAKDDSPDDIDPEVEDQTFSM